MRRRIWRAYYWTLAALSAAPAVIFAMLRKTWNLQWDRHDLFCEKPAGTCRARRPEFPTPLPLLRVTGDREGSIFVDINGVRDTSRERPSLTSAPSSGQRVRE